MNQILETNIFFLITGLGVIVITAGVAVALYYIIHILRDVRKIVSKLNKASNELEQDFEILRSTIKDEGSKVRTIVDMALGFFLSRMKKRATTRKPKNTIVIEDDTLQ